jgi:transcriptional regulator with XRE-family HTH domain
MNLSAEIAIIEDRIRDAGKSVSDLCRGAGIARSTWDRWKRGETAPNLATWGAVRDAADRISEASEDAA